MQLSAIHKKQRNFIIIRRFVHEAQASLYSARLREAGIENFISNSHTGTLIPFVTGGFLLHVRQADRGEAEHILKVMDSLALSRVEEDFRDADLGDIAYEKALYEHELWLNSNRGNILAVGVIILVLLFSGLFIWIRING